MSVGKTAGRRNENVQALNGFENKLRVTAVVCGLFVAVSGAVVLFSWEMGWRLVSSLSDDYISMAPGTAVLIMVSGSCMAVSSFAFRNRPVLLLTRTASVVVAFLATIPIFEYVFDFDAGLDHLLFESYGYFQGVSEGHISPLSAILLIASALSLLLASFKDENSRLSQNTAASLAFGVILAGLVFCTGYLYGTPILYGETIIPIALSAAIVFVVMGVGLVAAAGAGSWLADVVSGVDTRSRLLRVLIPIITLALVVNGWIEIKIIDPKSGNVVLYEAVLVLVFTVVTGFVIFRFSRSIGGSIDVANELRLQVEKELRTERDFARNLVETSPSGIISMNAEGKIIFANQRAEEILGLSTRVISQRTYNDPEWKHTDLDGRPLSDERLPFRTVMDSAAPIYGIRYAIKWPDGKPVLISVNGIPVFDDRGRPAGMVAAIEDITDQVEASRKILREKNFGDIIINSLPGIFYMFSEESGMYRFNQNFMEISGYSHDELLGMEPLEFIPPEDREYVGNAIGEVYSEGFSTAESSLLTKDGSRIPFYFTGYRLKIEEGVFLAGTGIDISRRVAAENNLKRETQKAQRYLDIAGVMLITIGPDETINLINKKGCEILGYPQDQILGQNWFDRFIPAEQRETVRKVFHKIMAGEIESVESFENAVLIAGGEERTIAWHNIIVRDESGKIVSSFSSGEDVTERRATEKAVADSESRYRNLFENLSDAAFLADAESGTVVETNNAGEKLLGRPRSEIVGLHQSRLHPSGEAEKYQRIFREHVASGAESQIDGQAVRKDGTRVPISISSSLMEIEGRKMILGLFSDMSERLAAEKAVRESEERYHSLFEESRDAIFISSPEGRFLDINPAGVRLFGYSSKEEMLQIDIVNDLYLYSEDREKYREMLASQGFVHEYSTELKSKSGKKIIGSITATAVHDNNGAITAYRGTIRDITEQRNLQEQLIQAQKMEGIGRLAGGVAHDFNNFLTAIQGYTDLALKELSDDHPAREDVVEARASSKRAADLTRQLLLFSRRESMNLKPIDLNAEISGLLSLLSRIIGENYEIVTDLANDLWSTKADPAHMEQIIMNLVVNARDAMADGGQIFIRTRNIVISDEYADRIKDAQPGNYACVSVVDTGSGIDNETMIQIFEPFFSTKKGKHGTGLGLSVVYGIIAEHGGWIEVESGPGRGSGFHVFLPAFSDRNEIDTVSATGQYGEFSGRGERLLLVEDEASVRAMAETTLTRNGYLVVTAADSAEAENLFNEAGGDYDLLFSDVVLPGENGLSLAQRLSSIHPGLPVLLASGYNEEVDQETINRLGYRFLQKPYPMAELLSVLRELLDGARMPPQD